jgi:hypothetical protein
VTILEKVKLKSPKEKLDPFSLLFAVGLFRTDGPTLTAPFCDTPFVFMFTIFIKNGILKPPYAVFGRCYLFEFDRSHRGLHIGSSS